MMNLRFDDANKRRMDQHIDRMDQSFDEFMDDIRRGHRSNALPGQQAHPEGTGT